jgi:glycosyltransferase involved in cell wall biosynthesis
MKRILFITGTWPPMACGVGEYSRQLAAGLLAAGLEIGVLTSSAAKLSSLEKASPTHPRFFAVVERWDRNAWRELEKAMAAFKPDGVHLQYPAWGYGRNSDIYHWPARLRLAYPGLPCLVTLHEYTYFPWWTRLRIQQLCQRAAAVVYVDPLEEGPLRRAGLGRQSPMVFIPNAPLVGDSTSSAPREFQPRQKALRLAYFGLINRPKGLETLLLAMLRLPEAELDLIGPWDPAQNSYHARLAKRIARLGLTERVRNLGALPTPALIEKLQQAHALVLPFRNGLSLKHTTFLTGLGLGLAVVVSAPRLRAGLYARIRDGKEALFFPARSVAGLAVHLSRLAGEPALLAQLRAGASALGREFTWEQVVAKHLALYREAGMRHA